MSMPRTTASKRPESWPASGTAPGGSVWPSLSRLSDRWPPARRCWLRRAHRLAQRHAQPPRPRALERRALQPVHRVGLCRGPAPGSCASPTAGGAASRSAPCSAAADLRGLGAQLRAPHGVHRLDDHRDDVEAAVADVGLRQRQGCTLGVGGAPVHASCRTSAGSPPCASRSAANPPPSDGPPLGGEQQPLGVQVMLDGDVVLATAHAGLVDAHDLHALEASRRVPDRRRLDAPHSCVAAPQQCARLAHRQLAAQRQRQGFEGGREARARPRPQARRAGWSAAAAAGHARHVGSAARPRTGRSPDAATCGAAGRARAARPRRRPGAQQGAVAPASKSMRLDATSSNTSSPPRRLQTQRAGTPSTQRSNRLAARHANMFGWRKVASVRASTRKFDKPCW